MERLVCASCLCICVLMVYCYVSIVITIQFFVWSVVLWIRNTLYTSKFFVLVFGCHIYLTLGSPCFILYIGTAHYSILQFCISLSTCLAAFFACIMCSRLQHYILQMNPALLQFGHIINVYLYHVHQLVPFDINYSL